MSGISQVITRGEDVSEYVVGEFKDKRLLKTGALLFKRICSKMTICIKQLANNRAMEVSFNRFLHNSKTSVDEIEHALAKQTNISCTNKTHVLCIQDTVEVNYPKQKIKKDSFGPTGNKNIKGFFAHPAVMLDADSKDILGLSSIKAWVRSDESSKPNSKRPIEKKESFRWLEASDKTKDAVKNAGKITIICDREGDIYELLDRIPDEKTDLLLRSNYDRDLLNGVSLCQHMANIEAYDVYDIELRKITGGRKARKATMAIKHSKVTIKKPKYLRSSAKGSIELTCVEAQEVGVVPEGETPIFWRILTTHEVNDLEQAKQIVVWYTWRWTIEQIFRTMKKKGINIESSQIETPEALLKMFILSIAAAINVLSLVHARDGESNRPATDIFNSDELLVLALVLASFEGSTNKQKNPFPKNNLSWASWIIARLGGWNGYTSESPPGPITMYRGMEKFYIYLDFWLIMQKDVCIG